MIFEQDHARQSMHGPTRKSRLGRGTFQASRRISDEKLACRMFEGTGMSTEASVREGWHGTVRAQQGAEERVLAPVHDIEKI